MCYTVGIMPQLHIRMSADLCGHFLTSVLNVVLKNVELFAVVCFRQVHCYQCQCSWHTWFRISDGAILSSSE